MMMFIASKRDEYLLMDEIDELIGMQSYAVLFLKIYVIKFFKLCLRYYILYCLLY